MVGYSEFMIHNFHFKNKNKIYNIHINTDYQ